MVEVKNHMKHDLKGYQKYHTVQEDTAPADQAAAGQTPAGQPETAEVQRQDLIYEPGQEPGSMPIMGDLNCELGDLSLLGMEAEQICKRCQELEDQHLRTLAEMEAYAQSMCRGSPYHQEAIRRFKAKEPLRFDWDRAP